MEFETVYPKIFIEKINQQLKNITAVPKERAFMGADKLRLTPSFEYCGVGVWLLRPPILYRNEVEGSFDVYISDCPGQEYKYPMAEVLAGFDRVEKKRYKKVRCLYLQNSDESLCNLYLKFFARRFLCKKLKNIIEISKDEIYFP